MESAYRIGLIGSAGLGKGSLSEKIASKLDIVFLRSKDITRPVLKEYGYDFDRNSECVERFLSEKDLEYAIVDKKINQEKWMSANGFVTDRTTLECFAYALLSVEKYTPDEMAMLERICRENMGNYTHLFYFPYKNGWLEDNGVRTVNTFFQWKIDMLVRGLISDWGINAIEVHSEAEVNSALGIAG